MRYVKYIGPSHQRGITAQDWRSVGITGDTVFWNAQNGFALPLDRFSDDQLEKAIYPDPYLVVTGEDEDFTPVHHNRDMTPSEATQAVEAPVDVLGMVGGDDDDSVTGSGPSNTAPGTRPTGVSTGRGSGHDE